MIFKWIHCKVASDNKEAFSKAQSKWNAIAKAKGFVGQLGGWDTKDTFSAYIISLWEDQESFNNFMRNLHDEIVANNNQNKTYLQCNVNFFDPILPMPGKYQDLASSISESKYMRVADCYVKANKVSHFKEVQKKIWIPEMAKSKGMLGGQFSVDRNNNRFLVTTLWDSEENHNEYVKQKVSTLRETANVTDDLEKIKGHFVKLESSWMVLPK